MEEFYKLVIRRLAVVISSNPPAAAVATPAGRRPTEGNIRKILDLFIIENHGIFPIPRSKLDPFPDDEFFRKYLDITQDYQPCDDHLSEDTLETMILNVEDDGDGDYGALELCTKEPLVVIRELLSSNKKALADLVKQGEGKRSHDECTHDPIHCLIRLLVLLRRGWSPN